MQLAMKPAITPFVLLCLCTSNKFTSTMGVVWYVASRLSQSCIEPSNYRPTSCHRICAIALKATSSTGHTPFYRAHKTQHTRLKTTLIEFCFYRAAYSVFLKTLIYHLWNSRFIGEASIFFPLFWTHPPLSRAVNTYLNSHPSTLSRPW